MVNTLEERFHYQDQAILKDHVLRLKLIWFYFPIFSSREGKREIKPIS